MRALVFMAFAGSVWAEEHPVDFAKVDWPTASVEDMRLLEPYVGAFRGDTLTAQSGTEYFFLVRYEWYDRPKQILKYTLTTHIPERGEARPLGEGFYRFDPTTERIEVAGIFRDGRAGSGFMSVLDPQTHEREVRIQGASPDGTINQVRDTFWIIDEDTWGNRTFIATPEGEWQVVSEGTYRRVEEG
ncbi:MAG: hypothetical protein R3200_10480 [Xanthomonadales bacterium]|nr:hypothetical protein [Xanthomonadales bacterium]